MTAAPSRLLLLDGHSLAYRAFFALPVENFATAAGQPTNAVYGFTSMLVNVLRDEQPTHVAVAFDKSRQTFRLAEYPEYKAKRNKTPDEFSSQLSLIREVLDAFHIQHLELDGYEADDIIATLVTEALAEDTEVLILTGDRDSLQLVTPDSTVLYPMRGVSDLARMTPDAVEAKYGVAPGRYPELAALVGEDSDNLPGVPGVGPKTAAKWLATYDGLENLITRADEVTGKAGENLREHLDDVIRNRRLNALIRDLPLPVSIAELAREEWDRQASVELLDELEFRGELRTRILDVLAPGGDEPAVEAAVQVEKTTVRPGELAGFLERFDGTPAALYLRGAWGAGTGHVDGFALAHPAVGATYLDVGDLPPTDEQAWASWLADAGRPKVIHDANGPLLAMAAQGWTVSGLVTDTAMMAYLVAPDQRSYALGDLSLRYLKRELRVDAGDVQAMLFETGDEVADTAILHAQATLDLAAVLEDELSARDGVQLLREIELPLVDVLVDMERAGIAVDHDLLTTLEAEFGDAVRAAAAEACGVIGREINLGSPKQLQVVLFDELNMPKTKKTKTGYTTDADALQQLFEQTEHPFLAHLLRHRDVSRLRQTVEGLIKTVAEDGRIHTTFNQLIAATGRLSSTDPNLQNIPVRTEAGRRIREVFVVGDGYESLMTADYSQIEMRIMAHLSEDAGLIEAFNSGLDFHAFTAARVFDVSAADVTP
ncbi:MAG: DNA polymerase I [Marmoricola sp.]